ncbi:monocarboxylate transporter 7-like [Diadema antillarum]|uniref:monocarboxylate transporter 7-like n=1 Tax=Diadema antillarum TaxID=105358 RepID=UPI003A89B946
MSTRETSAYCQPALLVAVMFIRSAFQMGVIKSVGVFLSNIQASLGESDTGIGVALGLFSACISSPAPLVGYFYGRLPSFSRRMMLIAGPLLSSLGLVLASLAVNYVQFSASLGLSGVGFSFMLMCILLELSEQARTHFGLFLSIGSTGFAAGMSVIPLLGEFLMNVYGWRGAMLILGGLMGNLIPMIAAIRPKTAEALKASSEFPQREIHTQQLKMKCYSNALMIRQVINAEGDRQTLETLGLTLRTSFNRETAIPYRLKVLGQWVCG